MSAQAASIGALISTLLLSDHRVLRLLGKALYALAGMARAPRADLSRLPAVGGARSRPYIRLSLAIPGFTADIRPRRADHIVTGTGRRISGTAP